MDWNLILCALVITYVASYAYAGTICSPPELCAYKDAITLLENFSHEAPVEITPPTSQTDGEYDFIIVGAGSAGAVIANRLSEITSWNILLLEAGYPENTFAESPTNTPFLQFTNYNWGYTTERQPKQCLAMEEQRCAWPRGKALGGSSVINYMIYTRGNPEDYNRWADLGNPGWSYNDVLPYFLKFEDSNLKNFTSPYHNKGGYQSVEFSFNSEIASAFIEAGNELGYKYIDHNGPEPLGFSRMQKTTKFGRRHSTSNAFLRPILNRNNLRIITGATVTKIIIDPVTKKAQGVIYSTQNNIFSVKARKEVVISAGALNSPQLLMLSGIGPEAHLQELGIELLNDLPVGQILNDHPCFYGLVLNTNLTMRNLFDAELVRNWYTNGEGPLANVAEHEAIAFIKTNVSTETSDYPDIELFLSGSMTTDNGTISRRVARISDEYYEQMYVPLQGVPSFTIVPVLLHPKSKGYMKLRSSNPYDYPLFYSNYLTDSENSDVRTLTAAMRFIEKLTEAETFKKYNVQLNRKPFVGCEHLEYNSDAYWHCAFQLLVSTSYHPMSTCKMGTADDKTAIVNHQLKVYGIQNLRVADASIIPFPLSGHTNAPTIMIGEKASDLIKKDWEVLVHYH